jgi:hypothetical protein
MNRKKKIDTLLVPEAKHTDRAGERDDSNPRT